MQQKVRIFKLFSGELLFGKLASAIVKSAEVAEGVLDATPLKDTDSFTLVNPFTLHYSQQGVGIAPIISWCKPDLEPKMEFQGSSVMGEVTDVYAVGSPHTGFINSYLAAVSPIDLSSRTSPIRLVPPQ